MAAKTSPPARLSAPQISALLSPPLGEEQSAEAVITALNSLRLPRESLDVADVGRVLELLAQQGGIVGLAARFGIARLPPPGPTKPRSPSGVSIGTPLPAMRPREPSDPMMAGLPRPAPVEAETIPLRELVAVLTPRLGKDMAGQVVNRAARRANVSGDMVDIGRAMRLLDAIAEEHGVVGVAARFAKARLILRFPP